MDNWSLIDPPGWITASIPAFPAISTQSGNGKKASLAMTAPFKSKLKLLALLIACSRASTREVCPVPPAQSCLFLTKIMVLDFVCLQIFEANKRSSISAWLTFLLVTFFKSSSRSVLPALDLLLRCFDFHRFLLRLSCV